MNEVISTFFYWFRITAAESLGSLVRFLCNPVVILIAVVIAVACVIYYQVIAP